MINDLVMNSLTFQSKRIGQQEARYLALKGRTLPEGMPETMANFIVYQVIVIITIATHIATYAI